MKIYLIRHGQSTDNRDNIISGWNDCALTEDGKTRAKVLREYLRNTKFDSIYCSDLPRVKETASIIFPKANIEYKSALREYDAGELTGMLFDEASNKFADKFLKAVKEVDYKEFGGESYVDVWGRVVLFLKELLFTEDRTVAIVSSWGPISVALDYAFGVPQSTTYGCGIDNCSVSIIEHGNTSDCWSCGSEWLVKKIGWTPEI